MSERTLARTRLPRRWRHPGRRLAVALLVAMVCGACGIPLTTQPQAIDKKALPKRLSLAPTTTRPTTTTTTVPAGHPIPIDVYFLKDGTPGGFGRYVPHPTSTPALLQEALLYLVLAPLKAELRQGYVSFLAGADMALVHYDPTAGVATVNLCVNPRAPSCQLTFFGGQYVGAIEQTVFTLTCLSGAKVKGVDFQDGLGNNVASELPDGTFPGPSVPISRANYRNDAAGSVSGTSC